jgi:hypothetical protein
MDKTLVNQTFLSISCLIAEQERIVMRTLPSNWHIPNRIFTVVVNSLLIIPIVLLNVMAIVTIQKSSQLKNRPCYFAIVLQSAADIGVGCFTIPITTFFLASPLLPVGHCIAIHLIAHVGYTPVGISIITLSLITIERYIGVVHPYSYATLVTKRRILVYVIGGILLNVLVTSVLSFKVHGIGNAFFATLTIAFFALSAFVYARIYLIIRKLVRSKVTPSHENGNRKRNILREMKHARSCFLVVVCFIFCMTPFLLSPIILHKHGLALHNAFVGWSVVLGTSNCIFNSMIFFWTKTLMRKEAIKIIKAIWA